MILQVKTKIFASDFFKIYNRQIKQIKSIPNYLRPREKILKLGSQALTIEELLSVVLITGTKLNPVSKLANKFSKLTISSKPITKDSLAKLGLGPSKTAQILAAIELGARLSDKKIVRLTSAENVYAYSHEITRQEKETLLCFYLNGRGEMIKKEIIAVGALNRVNLLPKEIFGFIKEMPVSAIILVHNHPSGELEPSEADILFTKRVKMAGEILGIKLLDHLIVSSYGWKRIKTA